MTVGDFNNDGRPRDRGPRAVASGHLSVVVSTVDPKTLAVSKANQNSVGNRVRRDGAGIYC